MKKIVVANWKMAPDAWSEARAIFLPVKRAAARLRQTEMVICPPAVFLPLLAARLGRQLRLGGQDIFWNNDAVHTGQLSAAMIKHAGATYVLAGHSEKRVLGDTDELVNLKIKVALKAGLRVIFCVGEKTRDHTGHYLGVLRTQVERGLRGINRRWFDRLLVAYEPIWAIGARAVATDTPADFLEQALFIRKVASGLIGADLALALPVLYGGSVDSKNAGAFLTEGRASGLLVGRASLRADHFRGIIQLAETSS